MTNAFQHLIKMGGEETMHAWIKTEKPKNFIFLQIFLHLPIFQFQNTNYSHILGIRNAFF